MATMSWFHRRPKPTGSYPSQPHEPHELHEQEQCGFHMADVPSFRENDDNAKRKTKSSVSIAWRRCCCYNAGTGTGAGARGGVMCWKILLTIIIMCLVKLVHWSNTLLMTSLSTSIGSTTHAHAHAHAHADTAILRNTDSTPSSIDTTEHRHVKDQGGATIMIPPQPLARMRISTKINSIQKQRQPSQQLQQPLSEQQQPLTPPKIPSLVIAGMVQNAEMHLPKLFQTMKHAVQGFHIHAFIFFENDSTDRTVELLYQSWDIQIRNNTTTNSTIPNNLYRSNTSNTTTTNSTTSTWSMLKSWAPETAHFIVLTGETNLSQRYPERTQRIAHGRNTIMMELFRLYDDDKYNDATNKNLHTSDGTTTTTTTTSSTFDYLLWMDMDDVNYELTNAMACIQELSSNKNRTTIANNNHTTKPTLNSSSVPLSYFGGCCVNQYTIYYDLWALRATDWVEVDIWHASYSIARVSKLHKHIPSTSNSHPIQVQSCFGGAALYNMSFIQSLRDALFMKKQEQQRKNKNNTKDDDTDNTPLPFYSGIAKDENPSKSNKQASFSYRICEHVPFHQQLHEVRSDFTLYIVPSFLNNGPLVDYRAMAKARPRLSKQWTLK